MSLDIDLLDPTASPQTLYSANITHNLTTMADKAGIYKAMWRPEEIQATQAKDIIPIIEEGLKKLVERPDYFKQFSSSNGWGTYEQFVPFVRKYLNALKEYPMAKISVFR